jgi:hypothetical protein
MMRLKPCTLGSRGKDHEIKVQRSETTSKEVKNEEKKSGVYNWKKGGGGRK